MASEEAVEFDELDIFLRRNEDYKPFEDDPPLLRAEPIGVPGAYSPLQMYPKHASSRSPSPSPLKLREKEKSEINAGDTLAEFGLANVSVSEDELRALVEELGLGGDEASDLVKGLSSTVVDDTKDAKVAALETGQTKEVPKAKPEEKSKESKETSKVENKGKEVDSESAGNEPVAVSDEPEPAVAKVSPPEVAEKA